MTGWSRLHYCLKLLDKYTVCRYSFTMTDATSMPQAEPVDSSFQLNEEQQRAVHFGLRTPDGQPCPYSPDSQQAVVQDRKVIADHGGVVESNDTSTDTKCSALPYSSSNLVNPAPSKPGPLLVMAGAGTGKTTTVAHRVAALLRHGVPGEKLLLMTFSRRAAREMTSRALMVLSSSDQTISGSMRFPWAGTFHSVANKLLRQYARHIGLAPEFSILDRADAADAMDVCRQELKLSNNAKRFPRKDVCLEIYSLCTNRQVELDKVIKQDFPWCEEWEDQLRQLFRAYVSYKQETLSLDYDDLLLYWFYMMQESWLAEQIRERFTHVLVDEYQDTNVLQAAIVSALCPDGRGLTVVGDDAQSIYSFRAADVSNIRNFATQFQPAAAVIDLAQNYRSHQRILDFSNALMQEEQREEQPSSAQVTVRSRTLTSARESGAKPYYVTVEDDQCQADYVAEQVLGYREQGIPLKQQAVLFRNAHHSDRLELELSRRNIPYVKYGGLKFLETAHVKDVLCLLRWSRNPQDQMAAFRAMQLIPGIGPALARKAWEYFVTQHHNVGALSSCSLPSHAMPDWLKLVRVLKLAAAPDVLLSAVLPELLAWYLPQMEHRYSEAHVRAQELRQLEQIATGYRSAEEFLADLTLDPPSASGGEAGTPLKDEDYLILSTVHSAKGQEWNSVFLLNVVDGSFPSEFATGDNALIEEERRLLYVASTRAKDALHLMVPLKFYVPQQARHGDRHVYGAHSRFLSPTVLDCCERRFYGSAQAADAPGHAVAQLDLPSRISQLW